MAYTPGVPVIRHKNRTGKDNPVSGAIQVIAATLSDVPASNVGKYQWSPPAGMNFEIIDISVYAGTVTSDPSFTAGTAAAGTQIVEAVNVTPTLGSLTLVGTSVTPSDTLEVRITCDAGDAVVDPSVTITGYCSVPPDNAFLRGDDGGHF